ncbi:pentapeptide repeat-containing protein [Lentzea sp.]|uniref:pentapeptide repeat-containing protein n=1 Tax=Lentzea sp. TaxID=56099 RepID=UPI002CEC1DF0|nr:pentapeptide repeat-containing protein [Lentzea sp.]HUQ56297.1 pentapeptide repeat-containing protein [Lentzea sp.]
MEFDELLDEGPSAFRTRWLGYDRNQVDEEYARLEMLLETACADRDAALATAEDLATHLEAARAELAEYRMIHAGYSKDNAVSGCIRYLMHVAKRKAEDIETEARARAQQAVSRTEEAAARQARLLDETEQETQRRLAEASQRAREIVGEALENSRGLLAELAERQQLLDQWYSEIATTPDLPLPRQAELSQSEVSQAELSQAELSQAELSQTQLSQAEIPQVEIPQPEIPQADGAGKTRADMPGVA